MRKFQIGSLVIHDITQDPYSIGYYLHTPISGIDFPAIRLASQDKPAEHGSIVAAQLYGGRAIVLTGKVIGSSVLTYNQNRRNLEAAIRIVKNNYISQPFLCKFTTDDGLDLQFYAFAQTFKLDEQVMQSGNFFLTLFAPDPYFYSQSLTTATIDLSTTPIMVTNNGDANSYPVLTFSNVLHHPIITNTDLSESFKLNVDIASTHAVVVDMAAKTIVFDATTNYNAYYDLANTWLSWLPGVNHLTLATTSGGDTGNVGISFRDAYVGF